MPLKGLSILLTDGAIDNTKLIQSIDNYTHTDKKI